MSELERVEREYRKLATQVIYGSFAGPTDPEDQRRLEALSDQRVRLTASDFSTGMRPPR